MKADADRWRPITKELWIKAAAIADSGINTKIAPEAWAGAISTMISAIKDGRPGDGFLAAVNLCGEQLARGLPPGAQSSKETTGRLVEI